MTTAEEHLRALRDLVAELDPDAVLARKRLWFRMGLPAASMPASARGANMPLPVADRADRLVQQKWREFDRGVRQARIELEAAIRAQNWFCNDPERLPDDPEIACSNIDCDQFLEPGRKSGECSRCRVWRHRHGVEFPKARTA